MVGMNEGHRSAAPLALDVRGFSFAYPDCEPVLRDVDLQVERGSLLMLVGSTGSGKTTLLRCLKPELAPAGRREGTARAFGVDLVAGPKAPVGETLDVPSTDPGTAPAGARDTAALVGYVAQSPENQIVCDSVWHELAFGLENLGTPQETMRRRVAEVAHFFGIEPWFRRDTAGLSGGQKQILNLASVLAMQPQVLLLDEPTAQLDPVASKNFLHALFRINRELGITVVVATHAPESMVDYATACVRMEGGRPVPADLAEFEQHFEEIAPGAAVDTPRPAIAPAVPADADLVLRMDDVFFRYARDAAWVMRGASLEVRRGSIHALVGGNGCGKSTMLRLSAGALKPERGKVHNPCLSTQVLLPQDPKALFVCDTLAEELDEWRGRCGYTSSDERTILERFGLAELAQHHPYDISGGQQQKLAMAKLLLTGPELLLLDEPTKGLDAPSRCEMARILLDLRARGVTVLLVTHDLSFVSRVADTCSMLFDGEVTCTEPTDTFFANNLFYRPAQDAFMRLWDGEGALA